MAQYDFDAVRFGDFIKTWRIDRAPDQYINFMIMEILHLTQPEIDQMDYIAWNEAANYAMTRIRMTNMTSTKQGTSTPTIHYDQPQDYDYDPKFYSKVT